MASVSPLMYKTKDTGASEILKRLTMTGALEKIEEDFFRLKDDRSRLLFGYSIVVRLLPDPTVLKRNYKSQRKSNEMRMKGNELYERKDYFNALSMYQYAMIFAPDGSKEKTLAYSNCSAALFCCELYEECLESIDLIIDGLDDEALKSKLTERKRMCEASLGDPARQARNRTIEEARTSLFSFRRGTNPKIPSLSSSVQVSNHSSGKRSILARENIQVGEMIMIERVHQAVHFCNTNKQYYPCSYCGKVGVRCCKNCDFLLCNDQECRTKYDSVHKYECALSDFLVPNITFGLRKVLQAIKEYGTVESFEEAVRGMDKSKKGTLSNAEEQIYNSRTFAGTYSHPSFWTAVPKKDKLPMIIGIALVLHLMKQNKELFSELIGPSDDINNSHLLFIGEMLLYFRTVVPKITHENQYYINAIFNIFGHSCAPNGYALPLKNNVAVVAIKPIKKGEEIQLSYSDVNYDIERSERRLVLLRVYDISCNCKACELLWPTAGEMDDSQMDVKIVKKMKINDINALRFHIENRNVGRVLDAFHDLCSDVSVLQECEPNFRFSLYTKILQDALSLFTENRQITREHSVAVERPARMPLEQLLLNHFFSRFGTF